MRRLSILALVLMCAACETTRTGTTPGADDVTMTAKQLRWFEIASYIRRCHGHASPRGAFWAAVGSALGAIHYVRTTPDAVAKSANAKRAVVVLMKASYMGRVGNFSPRNMTCTQVVGALAGMVERQSKRAKRHLARVVSPILRTDATGRRVHAQAMRRRGTMRRSYVRRTAPARHAGLKPSEQQLPIDN